jgi:hypothetical protein
MMGQQIERRCAVNQSWQYLLRCLDFVAQTLDIVSGEQGRRGLFGVKYEI